MNGAGMFERVEIAAEFIRRRRGGVPELARILANLRCETGRYTLSELLPLPFEARLLK